VFSLKIFNMEVIPFSRLKNETQNLFDQDLVVQSIWIFKSDQAVLKPILILQSDFIVSIKKDNTLKK